MEINDIKLPFGVRNNKIVHISEISELDRGLKCNCLCPECGQKLIARIGTKNTRHFAHHNEKCEKAFQTALHIFAKEVLEKNMKIRLPELKIRYNSYYQSMDDFKTSDNDIYFDSEDLIVKEGDLYFDKIEIEKRIDNIIPDIIAYKNESPLLIEVAVTHSVDEVKIKKLKNSMLSTLEINLKIDDIDYYNFNRDDIEKIIVEETKHKKWIFNRRELEAKKKILEKNKVLLKQEEIEAEEMRIILENKEKEEAKNRETKRKRLYEINNNYQNAVRNYETNFHKNKLWLLVSKKLKIKSEDIPEFLNCIVPGELAFECDRRIWQSHIFENFIMNRNGKIVKVSNVVKWAKKHSPLPINKDLQYTKDIDNGKVPDLTDAVLHYLLILSNYGFLQKETKKENYFTSFLITHDKLVLPDKSKEEAEKEFVKEQIKKAKEEERIKKNLEWAKSISIPEERIGVCRKCGKKTADWTVFYGEDSTCVCSQCR